MSSILLHVLWITNVIFGWVLNDVNAPLMVKPTFHLLFMFIPECRNVIFLSFFEFLDYLRIIRFYFSNLKKYTCRCGIFWFSVRERKWGCKMTRMKELCPLTLLPFHRERTSVGVSLFCGIHQLKKERCILFQIKINSRADLNFDYKYIEESYNQNTISRQSNSKIT